MIVDAYLGFKCNLKCKYCFLGCTPESDTNNSEQLYKVLEELEEKGTNVEYCIISGGETMMYYDDIIKIVSRFKDVHFKIVSNGTYPNEFKSLFDYSNVMPILSWDGLESERGFDSTPLLKELISSDKIFKVSYVVNNTNYMYLKRDIDFLTSLTDRYNEFRNPLFELAIARCKSDYYKFDLNILKQSMIEAYSAYPNIEIFRKQVECEYAKMVCNDMIHIRHNGNVDYDSCYSYVKDIEKLNMEYEKCRACTYDICKGKGCMMRMERALGYDNDQYCDIQRTIVESIEHVKKAKDIYDKYILNLSNIELILTTGCNLRCTYCFQSHTHHGNYNVMTRETIDKILEDYVDVHNRYNIDYRTKKISITLFGGEPIQSITEDIIKYLVDKLVDMEINSTILSLTNGYYYSEKLIDYIIDKKIDLYTQISLDINKGIHDTCRLTIDGRGSYDTVFSNIEKYILKLGRNKVSINSVITNYNSTHFVEALKDGSLVELIRKAKGVTIRGDQLETSPMNDQTKTNLKDFYDTVSHMYNNGTIDVFIFKYLFEVHKYNSENTYSGPDMGCGTCNTQITISVNGDVLPCHLTLNVENASEEYAYYNVHSGFDKYGVDKFMSSHKKYSDLVDFKYNDSKCSECSYRAGCVRCKVSYDIHNGGLSNVTDFTHNMTMIRNTVLIKNFGHRFKPLSKEEHLQFKEDYEYMKSVHDSGEMDLSNDIANMERIFIERCDINVYGKI